MSELEDKINSVLSDPDQLQQLTQMAKSLMDSGALGDLSGIMPGTPQNNPAGQSDPVSPVQSTPPAQDPGNGAPDLGGPDLGNLDLGSIGNLLGGLDPKVLGTLGSILAKSGTSAQKQPLLEAMMPYMSPERRDKLQRAMKLAKVAKVAGAAFGGLGGLGIV